MADSGASETPELGHTPPTEQERELANQATASFEQGSHGECATLMSKLWTSRDKDSRVIHNRAVINFYQSGFKRTEEFRKSMRDVCIKMGVSLDNLASLDDVDQCVVYYNYAVVLYHLRQYHTAMLIMDKLFTFIEPLGTYYTDESLSRKVMFLLIELCLCTHQPEKALVMLAHTEKMLAGNGKGSSPDKEDGKDTSKEKEMDAKEIEACKQKISHFKARCYMILKSAKFCKREIKTLVGLAGQTMPVVYLKANFEYIRGNYRKAIKVLSSAPLPQKPTTNSPENVSVMFYNNMAAIHFHMCKHHLGAFYLRKALQENEQCTLDLKPLHLEKSLSGKPVQVVGQSRHFELLYNMGVQLLHCNQPIAAFDCLLATTQIYHINPRLWLRLAEACIMVHRKNNDEDRELGKKLEVIRGTVGTGIHRKLILGPGLRQDKSSSESAAMPVPTLEFAYLCLNNARLLLPQESTLANQAAADDQSDTTTKSNGDAILVPAPPSNPMRLPEVQSLRCSVLVCSAYVALCLNDHLMSLQHAEALLREPRLSPAHRYLGQLYMGEALVVLDRIADAVQHLNPDTVTDISTSLPEHKQEQDKNDKNSEPSEISETKGSLCPWSPKDVNQAKAVMQYNLATAHTVRGEYEKARQHVSQCALNIGTPPPAQLYFLMLYLELMEGRRKSVQSIITNQFGHMAPNKVT